MWYMYTTCHCKSPHRSEPPFCIRDLSFGPNPKNQKNLKMHPKNIAKHQGKPKKTKKTIRVFKITCRRVILASFKFVWYFWVFWVFPRFLQCFFHTFCVFLSFSGIWRVKVGNALYVPRLKLTDMQFRCVCVASTRWDSVVVIGFVHSSEAHLVCGGTWAGKRSFHRRFSFKVKSQRFLASVG